MWTASLWSTKHPYLEDSSLWTSRLPIVPFSRVSGTHVWCRAATYSSSLRSANAPRFRLNDAIFKICFWGASGVSLALPKL